MEPRRGKANVPGFFAALAPLNFTEGDKVFSLVAIEGTNAKGNPFNMPLEGHLWEFNGAGKVVKFQHVADTATHWRMANM
jgi:hypothetical protein